LLSNSLWVLSDNLACKLEGFERVYRRYIGYEYVKEYESGFYFEDGCVLHIGCGSYPFSILMLAALSDNVSIVGIDNDKKAVRNASEIVKKYRLDDRVSIKEGDGCSYPIKGFNMVIISSCCKPRLGILKHVLDDARRGSRVFIRELNYNYNMSLSYVNNRSDVKVLKILPHNPLFFVGVLGWRSICVEKL